MKPELKALTVINSGAGRMRRISTAQLVDILRESGLEPTVVSAADRVGALAAVRDALAGASSCYQRLIVAGGDGTINSILPAFAEIKDCPIPLAILPVGSVNVLARELRIPRSLRAAVQVAARGGTRPIDLGIMEDHAFAIMAGIGFDAAAVASVRGALKSRMGSFAYVYQGLKLLLTFRSRQLKITADEQVINVRSWQAIVTNAASYTYGWRIAPHARIDDGLLEVCVFPDRGILKRLWQVTAILLNNARWAKPLCLSGRRIKIEADEPVPVQLDGDPFPAALATTMECIPGALKVMVPAERSGKQ